MPVIEYTISIGNILTIFAVIGSVMGLVYSMKNDINLLKNDMVHLEQTQRALSEAFAQLGSILTSVAVQDTRLALIEKKLDELSHGRGFVDDVQYKR